MSPTQSFKNFREKLAQPGLPAIPYLGVYLTDLTFIDDGNPSEYGDGMINFTKRQLVAGVLNEVLKYQQSQFDIKPEEPLFSFLKEFPALDADALYKLSLTREPRGAEITQIM